MSNSTCSDCCEFSTFHFEVKGNQLLLTNGLFSFILFLETFFLLIWIKKTHRIHYDGSYSPTRQKMKKLEKRKRQDLENGNIIPKSEASSIANIPASVHRQSTSMSDFKDYTLKRTLLRSYIFYLTIACVFFFLESFTIFLPAQGRTFVLIRGIILALHCSYIDNSLIAFHFTKRISFKESITYTFILTTLSAIAYVTVLFYYAFEDEFTYCPWCSLFVPNHKIIYYYIIFAVIYFVIVVIARVIVKFRSAVVIWAAFLFITYLGRSIGILLISYLDTSFGHCVLNAFLFIYTLGFGGCVYYTTILDSRNCIENNLIILEEDLDEEEEAAKPLLNDSSLTGKVRYIKFKQIQMKEVIGKGAFGQVKRGFWNNKEVAVKILNSSEEGTKEFLKEVNIISSLSHKNVVGFLGVCTKPTCLVIEYVSKGNLWNIIHESKGKNHSTSSSSYSSSNASNISSSNSSFPPNTGSASSSGNFTDAYSQHVIPFMLKLKVMLDTAKGMKYLHDCNIIHRDLKPQNLLVDHDWTIKIADFGLARTKVATTMTKVGTPRWVAPEVIRNNRYSEKADVYSFAIIFWEVETEEIPFGESATQIQVITRVAYNGESLPIPSGSPCASLMRECMILKPAESRLSFAEIIPRLEKIISEHQL